MRSRALLCLISFFLATSMEVRGDFEALDATFGSGGRVATNFSSKAALTSATAVVLQPDGKLIVAGATGGNGTSPTGFSVARLLPNGSTDATFAGFGQVQVYLGEQTAGYSLALQPDGKIVVAAQASSTSMMVARFLPNGSPDPGFNGTGAVFTPIGVWVGRTAIVLQADGAILVAASGYSTAHSFLVRYLPNGAQDPGFGPAYTGIVELAGIYEAQGLAVQPDGKILVAGSSDPSSPSFALARLLPDGTRDITFTRSGIVLTSLDQGDRARAVAIQSDGKIVVAGTTGYATAIGVVRYESSGSLDASFGTEGKVMTPVGNPAGIRPGEISLALAPNGRIVVAGSPNTGAFPISTTRVFLVARYGPTGALDASFGGTGIVTTQLQAGGGTSPGDSAQSLALQPDGRIVVAGTSTTFGPFGYFLYSGALARYQDNGSLDPTFGASGRLLMSGGSSADSLLALVQRADGTLLAAGSSDGNFALAAYGADGVIAWKHTLPGENAAARALVALPDGRAVLAGSTGTEASSTFTLFRVGVGGELDATFNGTGRVDTVFGAGSSAANAATRQPDGKLVVAGMIRNASGPFALARYNVDGSLDNSFGVGGKVTTTVGSGTVNGASAAALQPDGKILAAGGSVVDSSIRFALFRYNEDGSPDLSFGSNGLVTTAIGAFPGSPAAARAIALQPDGRIVVAGGVLNGNLTAFALARYNADGSPDTGFGTNGTISSGEWPPAGFGANAVAILPDGRILAVGDGFVDGLATFALARYLPNGAIDATFGAGGIMQVPMANATAAHAMALVLQSDGRLVVGGWAEAGDRDFDLVRVILDDTIAPDTALLATPPTTSGPAVAFSFNGTDTGGSGLASFECSLDGDAFAPCASPASYPNLAVGQHVFRVRGRDRAGNVDATPATWTWTVVPAAQVIAFAPLPDRVLANPPFMVSATGGGSPNPVVFSSLTESTCTTSGDNGSLVTLVAAGTCTVAADQAASGGYLAAARVTQSFQIFATGFVLTLSLPGDGTGRVTSMPAGIDCEAPCSWLFPPSSSLTLTASSTGSSAFGGWSGACSGGGTCQLTMDSNREVVATFLRNVVDSPIPRLANVSTRGQVGRDDNVMIVGFVIGGSAAKTVVIRAIGPQLTAYGVVGALNNPTLYLVRPSDQAVIAANDDWSAAANAADLVASGYAPSHMLESALYVTLAPGAYTAVVSGVNGTTGVGLVEVYEVDRPDAPLINISTRGHVGNDFDVMIGGFVLQGDSPQTVVIRAIGPSLAGYGVQGTLSNPQLALVRATDQTLVASNDDWVNATNAAVISASGFAPSNPLESAIHITLPPGAYTAVVSGVGGATGVGLIEVYKVP
jgi:uncharacterized delta-60 repeat protein